MAKEIIFITGKDPCGESGGGHTSLVRSTVRAAMRLGFTPRIFCVGRRSGQIDSDFGVIHRIASPLRSCRQITVPFHSSMLAAEVERYLSGREGPHLIHSISTWGSAGVTAGLKLRRRGHQVTTVVNAYTTMEHEAGGKLRGLTAEHGGLQRLQHLAEYAWFKMIVSYEHRSLLESDLVIINYDSVRKLLVEKYGAGLKIQKMTYAPESAFLQAPRDGRGRFKESVTEERLESTAYLPDSASPDPSVSLSQLRQRDGPLIVSVSRHDPRKGVDVLLKALAELRRKGARFRACILSGGPLYAAHRRLAERLELGETTVLTDWVSDPFKYLRLADIFVLPSLEEGSGSVSMLEAMQAGAAIVASNIDGIPEDVIHGASALLVEPGDASALGRALGRLIEDAALRARLARGAGETFLERFSAQASVNALRAVYADLGFDVIQNRQ